MTVPMTLTKIGEATVNQDFDLAPFGNVFNGKALQRVTEMLAGGPIYTESGGRGSDQNQSSGGYVITDLGGGNSSIKVSVNKQAPAGGPVFGWGVATATVTSMPTASISLP